MLIACWSSKGGSGTTVVSVALAALLAPASPAGALLVDLDGDAALAMGLARPSSPGIGGWLAAGASVPADALSRLEVEAGDGLRVLPPGPSAPDAVAAPADRAAVLAALLAADHRPVVVDCGSPPGLLGRAAMAAASTSLLVVRPCFLALHRARALALPATGVVLVREEQRSIAADDVEAALGTPVVAVVPVTPQVSRAVDAGVLATRVPRALQRSLRHVA